MFLKEKITLNSVPSLTWKWKVEQFHPYLLTAILTKMFLRTKFLAPTFFAQKLRIWSKTANFGVTKNSELNKDYYTKKQAFYIKFSWSSKIHKSQKISTNLQFKSKMSTNLKKNKYYTVCRSALAIQSLLIPWVGSPVGSRPSPN